MLHTMHIVNNFLGALLCLTSLAIEVKAVGCPPNEYKNEDSYYNVPSFGTNCEYRCRCVNDAQCDQNTGECPQGCARGWMGPACQYRNVSPQNKVAEQSQTLSNAKNAVDGDTNTCSDTSVQVQGSKRWWKVTFHRNFLVVGLKITVPETLKDTFHKFKVVTLTSLGEIEHVCYQHPDIAGSRIMEVMCRQPVNTSHLVIQLDKTDVALKLCEVDIYGGRLVSFNRVTSAISETGIDAPEAGSLLPWKKEHAVDGLPLRKDTTDEAKTCFASGYRKDNDNKYMWQVDLGRTYTVQDVNVFARWDPSAIPVQTQHYSINLRTSSGHFTPVFYDDPPVGYIPEFYQPRYSNLDIQMDADKVKITRSNGDRLFLCEVEIFAECPDDMCGWDCSIPCYCEAMTTGTYKINGTCPHGCKPGWTGDGSRCNTECVGRTYGYNCNETCGQCFGGETCNKQNGHCPGNCEAGFQLPLCKTICPNGRYGINCQHTCNTCQHQLCEKKNGICSEGCERGWRDSSCKQPCTGRTYGYNCNETCGYCSGGATCNITNGNCPADCDAGFQGPLCKTECPDGRYGINCKETCNTCRHGSCDKKTGACSKGCEQGWQGSWCNQTCDIGNYGYDCMDKCGHCSNGTDSCNRTYGNCPGDCVAGFQLPVCKTECNDTTYGVNCVDTCGACRGGSACDKTSGTCHGGCSPGWKEDEFCKQPCANGTHGHDCSETCGYCSNNATCDRQTGACPLEACQPGYQGSLCKAAVTNDDGGINIALIAGITVAIVVAAGLAVAIVYWRRRSASDSASQGRLSKLFSAIHPSKQQSSDRREPLDTNNSNNAEPNSVKPVTTAAVRSAHTGHGDSSDKYIAVRDVRTARALAIQNVSSLHTEYNTLPQGFQHEVNEATKPENKCKNRYKDMYTYDQNRVVLPITGEKDTSDYINASFIQGYRTSNAYIASQGTMKNTVTDMWRMIWHKDIRNIVMVTNCVEEGKMKCIQYWPDAGEEVYGNISVKLLTKTVCAEFTVRRFSCKLLTDDMTREVTQFHYTAWPDKDVPYTELSLVQFWRKVKFSEFAGVTPWLVHCSAGVGRTGTFIALDYLYDQGKAAGEISIYACVKRLRDQRIKTVQTQHQYVFLHKAIPEVLDPIGEVCKTEEFRDQLTNLRRIGNGQKESNMHNEFKKMGEDSNLAMTTECEYANISTTPEAYSDSSRPGNIEKCRDPIILPLNDFRVFLQMEPTNTNDFINAVRISTYTQKNGMILTQFPMANTAGDFVRMLWQYDLSIVVLMEDDVPQDGVYWPTKDKSSTVGLFTAELLQEQNVSSYTDRTIRYSRLGKAGNKDVTQFHFKSWPPGNAIPSGKSAMLQLLADVDSVYRNAEPDTPIVVQCINGADRSGLFCALWTLMDRMKAEREVAIAETVRLLRSRRPQCIPSFEQFEYIYDVVGDYLDTVVEYANVVC